jgi:outer membrane protein assembly factor BamA
LIFIFLTPKSWFASSELPRNIVHPTPVARTVVLSPQVVVNEADMGQIEQQVKALTGREKVEVLAVRKVVDADGKTRSFEVDIR